jgi:hypothetical protein
MAKAQRRMEIERNFETFEGLLGGLLPENAGQFALLSNRKLIGIFPNAIGALTEGNDRFGDGNFSVQRITARPLDLGFLSYASGERVTR